MKQFDLLRNGEAIIRVVALEDNSLLIMDCIKRTMPTWVTPEQLEGYSECTAEKLCQATGRSLPRIDSLDSDQRKVMYERYTMITILPEMRKKNFKGRCEKRVIPKCAEVCRTYDAIQYAYADLLQADDGIKEIRCNVLLDGLDVGEYTSDFVCVKSDGDLMVRECVYRKFLMKPLTVKLLDASKEYWLRHGVTDWGLVIDEEA